MLNKINILALSYYVYLKSFQNYHTNIIITSKLLSLRFFFCIFVLRITTRSMYNQIIYCVQKSLENTFLCLVMLPIRYGSLVTFFILGFYFLISFLNM